MKNLLFILDRSGSMQDMIGEVISNYNNLIKEHRKDDCLVTLVLFDDRIDVVYEKTPIKEIKELTSDVCYARGCTSLLDAMGVGMSALNMEDDVLATVMTDGMENSSREYSYGLIRKMSAERQEKNWTFLFLGANIDSYKMGSSMGVQSVANYTNNVKGLGSVFKSVSKVVSDYSECSDKKFKVKGNWADEIE